MSTPTKPKCPKCGSEALPSVIPLDFAYRCPRCGFGFTPQPEPMIDLRVDLGSITPIQLGACYSRADLTDKAEKWVKANFEERTQEYHKTLGILVHFISDHFPK